MQSNRHLVYCDPNSWITMDDAAASPALPASLFRRLRIKSRQIMLLNALDEHRNLRRAAAAIHTTQPAATALLQQLEEGLGVTLFERHARGMEPTVYGEVMIRYARGVLHDFEYAGDEMAALAAGAAGLVRIGSVMGATPVLLTHALAHFKAANPRVRVTLQVDTSDLLMPALLRGDLDVVLGRLPDQFYDEDLEIEQLEGEPMSVVARPGHPLFDAGRGHAGRPGDADLDPASAGQPDAPARRAGAAARQPGAAARHRGDLVDPRDHLAAGGQRHDLGGAAGRGAALRQLRPGRHPAGAAADLHGQAGHHHAQEEGAVAGGEGSFCGRCATASWSARSRADGSP